MPIRDSRYRDAQGRTFDQYVADQVLAAIAEAGKSSREVALLAGLSQTTFQRRINNQLPFNTRELALIADVLGVRPGRFVDGF